MYPRDRLYFRLGVLVSLEWTLLAIPLPASAQTTTAPATSQSASAPADAAELFASAKDLLSRGEAARAIDLLSEAVARRPDQVEYQIELARAYERAGRADAAARLLETIIQRSPADAQPRELLGALQHAAKRYAAAVRILAPVESVLSAAAVETLAECRARNGEASAARETLEHGVERFPRTESLWTALADRLLAERKFSAAVDAVAKARKYVGATPALSWRAAQAWFELGETVGGIETRRIADGEPGQFHRDRLIIDRGREAGEFVCVPPESALYQVRSALDGGIDLPAAYLLHARIWQSIGKPKVGFGILKANEPALLASADAAVYETFTRLALQADALPDFLRLSRRRAELDPSRQNDIIRDAYLTLAEKYNERGEEKMYVECLTRASELAPNDADLLLRRGDACWDAGRRDEAVAAYQDVLRLDAQNPRRQELIKRLADVASP